MYTSKKSTIVTLIITCIFCVLLAVLMVTAYPGLVWFFGKKHMNTIKTILYAFYVCCPAAWVALASILSLLVNILNEKSSSQKTCFICDCFHGAAHLSALSASLQDISTSRLSS